MRQAAFALTVGLVLFAGSAVAQVRGDHTTPPSGLPGYSFGQVAPPGEVGRGFMPSRGRKAADNLCLPPDWLDERGLLVLQDPGDKPGSCVFKSEIKERRCDCSIYRYRYVYSVGMTNDDYTSRFSPSTSVEEITPCVSTQATFVGGIPQISCPNGFQN